jgi:hypothetical protein
MQQKPFLLANLYRDVYALLGSNNTWQKKKNKRSSKFGKRSKFKKSKEKVKVDGTTFLKSDEVVHGFCEILAKVPVKGGKLKKEQFHDKQAFKKIVPNNYSRTSHDDDSGGFYGKYLTGLQNTGRAKHIVENEGLMSNYWGNHNIALIVYEKTGVTINPILGEDCTQIEKRISGADSGKIDEMLFFSRFCWNPNTVETIKNLTNDSQDTELKKVLEDDTFTKNFFSAMNHTYRQSIVTMTMVQKAQVFKAQLKEDTKIFQILSSRILIHLPNWIINVLQDQEIRNKTKEVFQNLHEKGCSIYIDSSLDKTKGETFKALRKYLGNRDEKNVQNLFRPLHLLDMCMFAILALFKNDNKDFLHQPRNKEMLEQKGWKYFMTDLGFSTQSFVDGKANPLSKILNDVLNHIKESIPEDNADDDDDDDDDDDTSIQDEGTNAHAETFLFRDTNDNPINELQIFEDILVVGSKGKKKKAKSAKDDESDQGVENNEELEQEPEEAQGVANSLPEDQSEGNDDTHPQSSDKKEEEADDLANVDSQKTMHDNEGQKILNQDLLQEIAGDVKMDFVREIEQVFQGVFHNFHKTLIEEVDSETRAKISDSLYEGIQYFFQYKYDVPFEKMPDNESLEEEEEFSQEEEKEEEPGEKKISKMKRKQIGDNDDDDEEEEEKEKEKEEEPGAKKISKMKRKQLGDNDDDDEEEEEVEKEKEKEEEPGAKKISKMKRKQLGDNDEEEEEKEKEKTPKKQKIEVKTSEEDKINLFVDSSDEEDS